MNRPTFTDFFSGIGGFSLGLERAGATCIAQVEKNEQCLSILAREWPHVAKYRNVITYAEDGGCHADIFAFSDPCPKHSNARSNGDSKHPDLSGYCLALAGRFRPWGVVRENVLAPTVAHFAAGLEALGYGTVIIRMDAAPYTGQSRQRDFVVGIHQASGQSVRRLFPQFADGSGSYTTVYGTKPVISTLTAHLARNDSCENYVWHPEEQVFRILDGDEREAFAGFPAGWTAELSESARARVCGNSLDPACAEKIGRVLVRVFQGRQS